MSCWNLLESRRIIITRAHKLFPDGPNADGTESKMICEIFICIVIHPKTWVVLPRKKNLFKFSRKLIHFTFENIDVLVCVRAGREI